MANARSRNREEVSNWPRTPFEALILLLVFISVERYLGLWDCHSPSPSFLSIPFFVFRRTRGGRLLQLHSQPKESCRCIRPSIPLAPNGISRRSFFRFAAGASAVASLPILTEAHFAYADRPKFADPNKGIHIDANENPMGPSEAARQAMINIVPRGGRYLFNGGRGVG